MAGVGAAQPQYWYAATINPALLVYNNQVMFNTGFIAESKKIISDTLTEKTKAGNLNYLATAFPLLRSKKDARLTSWTSALSLIPFTSVRYNVKYTDPIINSDAVTQVTESGTGGISKLTWANGVRLNTDLAIGLQSTYYFGSIVHRYEGEITNSQTLTFKGIVEQKYYVKDFGFTAGLSYNKDSLFSRQKYRLSLGLVYDFKTDLNTRRRNLLYNVRNNLELEADTLSTTRGAFTIPSSLTAGVALARGGWNVGLDVTFRDWSKFRGFEAEDLETYGKAWRYALGGEITPDGLSESFLKRITYRAGVSYEQLPYAVRTDSGTNSVKDMGVNVGLSVPTGRWSTIDVGFRYGRRGNTQDTIFEESYYRIFFGISFNDKEWFVRRKFD